MDPVGLTSRWVAAARARESERLDRLFDDPLAAALAGPEGFAWLDDMERAQPWGQPELYVVVRTRFFDDFLLRASWGAGTRQVVLLAAGMDARAFRMDWPELGSMNSTDPRSSTPRMPSPPASGRTPPASGG